MKKANETSNNIERKVDLLAYKHRERYNLRKIQFILDERACEEKSIIVCCVFGLLVWVQANEFFLEKFNLLSIFRKPVKLHRVLISWMHDDAMRFTYKFCNLWATHMEKFCQRVNNIRPCTVNTSKNLKGSTQKENSNIFYDNIKINNQS